MDSIVELFLAVAAWFHLLRRSPGRALIVLAAWAIALVALVAGVGRLPNARLQILLVVLVVLLLAAVVLWANLTVPQRPQEPRKIRMSGRPPRPRRSIRSSPAPKGGLRTQRELRTGQAFSLEEFDWL